MAMLSNKAGFLLLLLLALLLFEAHGDDALAEANQESLKTHEKMFKETVKVDLKKIGDEFDKFVEDLNTEMDDVRKYVTDAIKEIQENYAKANMESSDEILDKNIKELQVAIQRTFEEMNKIMMENLDTLDKETEKERKMLIDWIHQRNHLQEDIMKTEVSLCAFTDHHQSRNGEPVTYYNDPELETPDLTKARKLNCPSRHLVLGRCMLVPFLDFNVQSILQGGHSADGGLKTLRHQLHPFMLGTNLLFQLADPRLHPTCNSRWTP